MLPLHHGVIWQRLDEYHTVVIRSSSYVEPLSNWLQPSLAANGIGKSSPQKLARDAIDGLSKTETRSATRTAECIAFRYARRYHAPMSLSEIKNAVDALSPEELAELAAFVRERENRSWDRQIDADFAEGGRLASVAEEVRGGIRAGRLQDLP